MQSPHNHNGYGLICSITAPIVLLAVLLLIPSPAIAAGELDPTFSGGSFHLSTYKVFDIARQPDGKILIGGNFEAANGRLSFSVARLNPDRTPDTSFQSPTALGTVRAIALQSDGKILVGGVLYNHSTGLFNRVLRLNTDGSIDLTFAMPGGSGQVNDIEIQTDGKIFIAGTFSYSGKQKFARLNEDGSVDETFNPSAQFVDIKDIEIQPDGKVLGALTDGGGQNKFLKRYNPNGSEDLSFNTLVTGTLNALKLLPNGQTLIAGDFTFVNNTARLDAARINSEGTLDTSFIVTTNALPLSYFNDVEIDSTGNILLGGRFTSLNGQPRMNIVRVDSSGNTDPAFVATTALPDFINVILPLPDGDVLYCVGELSAGDIVYRLDPSGSVFSTFALPGARGVITDLIVQPDGKVLAAGAFSGINSSIRSGLARFNSDGSTDTDFHPFPSGTPSATSAIALEADGKILVGSAGDQPLVRLHPDGTLDQSFAASISGNSRVVEVIKIQPDGKLLIAGSRNTGGFVMRLEGDGSPDATFNTVVTSQSSSVESMAIQPDGRIVIVGSFSMVNSVPRGRIARLNIDGTLDNTFNPLGGASDRVFDVKLQSDGKMLIGGSFLSYNGTQQKYIARLEINGDLDHSFAVISDLAVKTILIEPTGKIVLGGEFTNINGTSQNRLTRLLGNGSIDPTFNIGTGISGGVGVLSIALQANNKLIIGGSFNFFNGVPNLSIIRLLNSQPARALFDFDGDGRSDIAVFRPSDGDWYQLLSGDSSYRVFHWGQNTDRLAPADYDGDGKTDIAVFRDSVPGGGNTGYFYVTRSSDASFSVEQFGSTGDLPVSGDWDGDGKSDLAVYRDGAASGGQSYFYYKPSGSIDVGFVALAWGATGDRPVVGDFDGDGKFDPAVFRPSTAIWYILRSSDGQFVQQPHGVAGDIPVAADFDGDGRTDFAVFRPSTGYWYTSTDPNTNYGGVNFGIAGDVPVPADYDGDGRADVAVFRPSNGLWYILRSTQGFTAVNFGIAGDQPAPSAFLH